MIISKDEIIILTKNDKDLLKWFNSDQIILLFKRFINYGFIYNPYKQEFINCFNNKKIWSKKITNYSPEAFSSALERFGTKDLDYNDKELMYRLKIKIIKKCRLYLYL